MNSSAPCNPGLNPIRYLMKNLSRQYLIFLTKYGILIFLQDIISDEPITADEFHARANAYSALGDVEKALADYTRAIELNPYYPLYWHSLAKFKFAHGVDSAIVLTDLSAALDVSEKDDLLMRFDILFFRAEILKRPAISITVWTA